MKAKNTCSILRNQNRQRRPAHWARPKWSAKRVASHIMALDSRIQQIMSKNWWWNSFKPSQCPCSSTKSPHLPTLWPEEWCLVITHPGKSFKKRKKTPKHSSKTTNSASNSDETCDWNNPINKINGDNTAVVKFTDLATAGITWKWSDLPKAPRFSWKMFSISKNKSSQIQLIQMVQIGASCGTLKKLER